MSQKKNRPLSPSAKKVLTYIVRHIRKGEVIPDDPRTFLGYKEIHDDLRLPMAGDTYGNSLKHQGLEELAVWARDGGFPAVSGLVVDREKLSLGDGYYEIHGQPSTAFAWWRHQVAASLVFDWSPYL
ncbi:MAG: hypothetical protein HYY17_03890 [Planctomycetes bacterium]|nr:hypothetical protein [Planctomycetota bacterium]